uniref:F-box domain-containing protein n=1 Tax=Panagrellus redivivus TaxID=6233 RepID=A0A7E4UUR0_PANRE
MRDLFDTMITLPSLRSVGDFSPKLMAFALSSRSAFFILTNYASENIAEIVVSRDNILAGTRRTKRYSFRTLREVHFVSMCQKYVPRVLFIDVVHSDEFVDKLCNFLEGMPNLEDVDLKPICWSEAEAAKYQKLLKAAARVSTVTADKLFLSSAQTLSTALHFPNLTKLMIRLGLSDLLSEMDVSKLTRHTFPVLENVHFESRNLCLSREGFINVAKFCDIIHRTVSEVKLSQGWTDETGVETIEYLNLIRNLFENIKFHNKFTLTVNVDFYCGLNLTLLEEAGFQLKDESWWCCETKFGDTNVVFNINGDSFAF